MQSLLALALRASGRGRQGRTMKGSLSLPSEIHSVYITPAEKFDCLSRSPYPS